MGDNHAAITCLNCGAENMPGSRFCSICGWPLLAPPTKPGEMPPLPAGVAQFEAMETMPITVQQQVIGESAKEKATPEPATQETVVYTDDQNPDDAFTGGSPSEDFVEEQTEENSAIAPSTTMMTVTKRAPAPEPQPASITPKPLASSMMTTHAPSNALPTTSSTNRADALNPDTTAGATRAITSAAAATPVPRRRSVHATATPRPGNIPSSIAPENHSQTSDEAPAAPSSSTSLSITTLASTDAADPSAQQTPVTDRADHNPPTPNPAIELPLSPLETALTKPTLNSTTLFLDDDLAIPDLPISKDREPQPVASQNDSTAAIKETTQTVKTVVPEFSAISPATTAPASTEIPWATETRHTSPYSDNTANKANTDTTINTSKPTAATQSDSAQHPDNKTPDRTTSEQQRVAAAARKPITKPHPAKKLNQQLEAVKHFFRISVITAKERATLKKTISQKVTTRSAQLGSPLPSVFAHVDASTKSSTAKTTAESPSLTDRTKNSRHRDTGTAAKDIPQQRTPREKRRLAVTLVVAFLVIVALSLVLGHLGSGSTPHSAKPSSSTSASAKPGAQPTETKPTTLLDAGLVSQASQQYTNSDYGFSVNLPQSFTQTQPINASSVNDAAHRRLPINSTANGAIFMDPNRVMSVSAWGQSTTAGQSAASVCTDEQKGSGHSNEYVYQQGVHCVVSYEANRTIYYDDAYIYPGAHGRSYFLEIQYPAASKSVGGELIDKIVASYVPGPARD